MSSGGTRHPSICEHGSLKRKCEICDLEAEVAELRAALRAMVEHHEQNPCDNGYADCPVVRATEVLSWRVE